MIPVVARGFGGPSTGSVELNRALNRLGHSATLLTSSLSEDHGRLAPAELAELSGPEIDVAVHSPSFPRSMQNSWGLVGHLARLSREADLLHLHGQYMLPHVAAYLIAKIRRIPYGIQPHGSLEPYQRAQSRLKKSLYWRAIGRRIISDACYVQFASGEESARASDVVRPDQARIAPLGATLPPEQEHKDISAWLGGTTRENVFVFLGRLAHKKRPDALIRAWSRAGLSENARLIIAGPDGDIFKSDLDRLASSEGVASSVYVAGEVSGPQRTWLLARAAVFVLPSENENFALAVAEAMLAGCISVVTRQVAASEHVERSTTGIVIDKLDQLPAALNEAARYWREEPAIRQRATDYARQHLTWDAVAKSIAGT